MGNGLSTKSVSEAVNQFVEREYPDSFKGVIFASQVFFPKRPDIIETDKTSWSTEQKYSLENQIGFIKGEETENCLFEKI